MISRVHRTLATLLLSAALTGCANFHRKPVAAAPPPPDAPELSQTPLYSPDMNQNNPRVPNLPPTSQTAVVQPPPPPPPKPRHARKPKTTVAKTQPSAETTPASATQASTNSGPSQPSAPAAESPSASLQPAEKIPEKKVVTQQASAAPVNNTPTSSPIGELTAGSAADAAETSHQTEDLIKTTRDGLLNIKRGLSSEEKKTAAEIQTFLDRAQTALKNGDVDGAKGLATKAKLLLDELTQK